ncbi:MAG: hypothetical protein BV459_07450 [Thermoplasmata archaeon M11B2D]|nr:MAG: hypothetical protein BV459_07450 [Thermoplasmata archaeon M11B2D]PNX54175.1 MAG: hypothetical protein BV458_00785 [Thermoplasmata archaeon M9B2D]
MKLKLISFCIVIITCTSAMSLCAKHYEGDQTKRIISMSDTGFLEVLSNDLLRYIEFKDPSISPLFGPEPGYYDTSEYFIGSVAVGVIFLESNGSIDPSTENWSTTEINNVQSQINQAMSWWKNQNQYAGISYILDVHTAVPTSYEPIIHPSAMTNPTYEKLWVSEAMAYLGYGSGDWMKRTRDYVNAMRAAKGTDWAFTVFVVDSSTDVDGCFSDGYFAYAYLGGPYIVMTYDNDGWGISAMNQVMAHETGHMFWATDEYDGLTEFSGYLNAPDIEGSGCLMDTNALILSPGTKLQVGWRDTDSDTILDIIDTNPETVLNPYPQNPTPNQILTYTGSAAEVPYPNNNPQPSNAGNDVTINHILFVFYRIDNGTWNTATPSDGLYDSAVENYTFTTPPLTHGSHLIEAFAINNVWNTDVTPAFETIIIDTPPTTPTILGPTNGKINQQYMYNCSANDMDGDPIFYWIDWGDGTNTGWLGPLPPGAMMQANHAWSTKGTYTVKVKGKDVFGMESGWASLSVTMPKEIAFEGYFLKYFLWSHPLVSHVLSFISGRLLPSFYK